MHTTTDHTNLQNILPRLDPAALACARDCVRASDLDALAREYVAAMARLCGGQAAAQAGGAWRPEAMLWGDEEAIRAAAHDVGVTLDSGDWRALWQTYAEGDIAAYRRYNAP